MEYNTDLDIDDSVEDIEANLKRERLEKMRLEKKKQQEQREMLKRVLPYAVMALIAAVLIISLLVFGIVKISHKIKEKKNNPVEIEIESTSEAGDDFVLPEVEEPVVVQIQGMPEIAVPLPEMVNGYQMDASNATSNISEEDVQSQFATLINASTGEVVVSKNGLDIMNPASMTKVMTVLVACERVTDLNQSVEVLLEDTDYAYVHDLSIAGFEAGEIVPLKDILYGAIMPSGGECCHALERVVAGDEDEFIRLMNEKAKELGLKNTHYTNSAGLYNENHYTTPVDMAMVMKAAIENDLCRQILHEHIYNTAITEQHPTGLELSNWFQRRIEDKYDYTEVLGAKTGYVYQSGNCATSYTVAPNGQVYICVTGNAHSAWRAIFDHVSLYDMYVKEGKK